MIEFFVLLGEYKAELRGWGQIILESILGNAGLWLGSLVMEFLDGLNYTGYGSLDRLG